MTIISHYKDNRWDVHTTNGKYIGELSQDDGGFYVFYPKLEAGHWTAELLKSIVLHLETLNALHQTSLNEYNDNQTLQSNNAADPI